MEEKKLLMEHSNSFSWNTTNPFHNEQIFREQKTITGTQQFLLIYGTEILFMEDKFSWNKKTFNGTQQFFLWNTTNLFHAGDLS